MRIIVYIYIRRGNIPLAWITAPRSVKQKVVNKAKLAKSLLLINYLGIIILLIGLLLRLPLIQI